MVEQEGQFNPEQERQKPTVEDVINICIEILGEEVVAEAGFEECGDIEEALGYAITLFEEHSIENYFELLAERGLIE